jgi:hypothetical protein
MLSDFKVDLDFSRGRLGSITLPGSPLCVGMSSASVPLLVLLLLERLDCVRRLTFGEPVELDVVGRFEDVEATGEADNG